MNLYFVISELLDKIVLGHYEEYHIAELVVARNRSQARYLVGLTDKNWCNASGDLRDLPRMSVRKLGTGDFGKSRIVTTDKSFNHWWEKTAEMHAPDYVRETVW